MAEFKWRDNLDFVNQVFDWWDKAAKTEETWTRNRNLGRIEGAILGATGKDVTIERMRDICEALDIPWDYNEDTDELAWGDEALKRKGEKNEPKIGS